MTEIQVKNIVTEIQVKNIVTEIQVKNIVTEINYVIPSITVVKNTSFSAKLFISLLLRCLMIQYGELYLLYLNSNIKDLFFNIKRQCLLFPQDNNVHCNKNARVFCVCGCTYRRCWKASDADSFCDTSARVS